jgi:branched-chain amino acid transport system ATP-binding protein
MRACAGRISVAELLTLAGVTAGYGASVVIEDVSFAIAAGESLALLGRNGVGKTTLIRTILGGTRMVAGEIGWKGASLCGKRPVARARAGIGWVPQQRAVFRSLTVAENLSVVARPGAWTLAGVYGLFPRLGERRDNLGDQLSGGEQQMLAIGRALMTNPDLLLLDEPLEGLAPVVAEEVAAAMAAMMRDGSLTTIVVEQHPIVALGMTRNAVVLERGRVVHAAPSAVLAQDRDMLERMLGIG